MPIATSILLITSIAFAQSESLTYGIGQQAKIVGLITSRTDDRVWIRDANGNTTVVLVTDTTQISSPKGILKVRKNSRNTTDLLPGLKVKVEGVGNDDGSLRAHKISFSGKDLKTAQQIAAAQSDLRQGKPALEQASYTTTTTNSVPATTTSNYSADNNSTAGATSGSAVNRGMLKVMDTGTVTFASSSFMLSPEAKSALDGIISKAQGTDFYMLEVVGFADNSGNKAKNRLLSKRRADSVVSYLHQSGQIPTQRILIPVGMGQEDPIANNDSLDGRAHNRRVEVNILVRKDQNQNQ